jgi:hypothetical protein
MTAKRLNAAPAENSSVQSGGMLVFVEDSAQTYGCPELGHQV